MKRKAIKTGISNGTKVIVNEGLGKDETVVLSINEAPQGTTEKGTNLFMPPRPNNTKK